MLTTLFSILFIFSANAQQSELITSDAMDSGKTVSGVVLGPNEYISYIPHPEIPGLFVEAIKERSNNPLEPDRLVHFDPEKKFMLLADGNKSGRFVPYEEVNDIKTIRDQLKNKESFKDAAWASLKGFPRESGKFYPAQIAVDLVACFGAGALQSFQFQTSRNNPLCVDHLIESLTSIKGNIGFYSFILANRISSKAIYNGILATSLYVNKPLTPEAMARLRAPVGYMGMAFGMAAQTIVSHILNIPSFKECARDIALGQFNSSFCQDAATHFLSAEGFWMDYGAGLPSLIGGGAVAALTQNVLSTGKILWSEPGIRKLVAEKGWSVALKEAKTIRTVKLITVAAGGGPGIVTVIVTELGQIALFLAWSYILEEPTTKLVWSLYDKPDIHGATRNLLKNLSYEKRINPNCVRVNPRSTQTYCRPYVQLENILHDLRFYSNRYRQKVSLYKLNQTFPDWVSKWQNYTTTYLGGKYLLQEIYRQRSKNISQPLPLYETTYSVLSLWFDYFNKTTRPTTYQESLIPVLNDLMTAFQVWLKTPTASDPSKPEPPQAVLAEKTLVQKLILFKKTITTRYPVDPSLGCQSLFDSNRDADYYFCRAVRGTQLIPSKETDFFTQKRQTNIYANTVYLKMFSDVFPLQTVLRQILCSDKTDLASSGNFKSGRAADLQFPRLVMDLSLDPSFQESCKIALLNNNDFFPQMANMTESGDFDAAPGSLWMTQFRQYTDPLSFLTDTRIRLATGDTEEAAQIWWNKNILKDVYISYVEFIKQYRLMIESNLIAKFKDPHSPQDLLLQNTDLPSDVSEASYQKIVGFKETTCVTGRFGRGQICGKWSQSSLRSSYVGQLQLLFTALEQVTNQLSPDQTNQLAALKSQFMSLFIEHLSHINYAGDSSSLDGVLNTNIRKLLQNPIDVKPEEFSLLVSKTLFQKSFDDYTQRKRQLQILVGKISGLAANFNLDQEANPSAALEKSMDQIQKMTPDTYKQYTSLQIIHYVDLLIAEVSDIYDNYIFLQGLFTLTPSSQGEAK